jgi:hypothetical protein
MFAAGAFTAIATYAILVVLPSEDRQPRRSMEARDAGRVLWSMAGLLALCEAGLIWTVFIASDLDRLPPVMASSMAFLGGAVLGCVGLLAFLAQTSADRERRKRSS